MKGLKTSLVDHYNQYQAEHRYHTPARSFKGSDGGAGFVLAWSEREVPRKVGPDTIYSFYSQEDGVWFPDSLALTMGWQGSSCAADCLQAGSFFNPFAVTDSLAVASSFTARMPDSHSSLQWALYQFGASGTTANRGNIGLASQDSMPDGLCKSEYLALTALRSFPTRQLHRLCDALRDRAAS